MKARSPDFDSLSIDETAADWFVRRRDGLPPNVEASYQAWIAADPRHAAAIAEFQATWDDVSFPSAVRRSREAAHILDRWAAARQRRPYIIAGASLAAATVWLFAVLPLSSSPKPGFSTVGVAVRPNIETLSDGSTVELNAGAEIAVEFTAIRRHVRLIRGEALFSVTHNAARPFVVSAGNVDVRAVGTAFAVRCNAENVGILVTEGRVAVERAAPGVPSASGTREFVPPAQPIYLDAGRQVAVSTDHSSHAPPAIKPLSAEEIGAALAWRNRRVEFSRMPLSEAAALFNQHNRVQLSIFDGATAAIPISGIFWSDDPEAFVRLLASGLGVRFERAGDTIILSSR